MPNQISTIEIQRRNNRLSKSLLALIGAFALGIVLVIFFNSDKVPFGRSLNKHPPQLIGLILIILAAFGLVVLCIRCLVLSSTNPSALASNTASYTFTSYGQQTNAWQAAHQPLPGANSQTVGTYSQYGSGTAYTPQQPGIPQTPPPEFELPPSYAEATKGLSTDVIK